MKYSSCMPSDTKDNYHYEKFTPMMLYEGSSSLYSKTVRSISQARRLNPTSNEVMTAQRPSIQRRTASTSCSSH